MNYEKITTISMIWPIVLISFFCLSPLVSIVIASVYEVWMRRKDPTRKFDKWDYYGMYFSGATFFTLSIVLAFIL